MKQTPKPSHFHRICVRERLGSERCYFTDIITCYQDTVPRTQYPMSSSQISEHQSSRYFRLQPRCLEREFFF